MRKSEGKNDCRFSSAEPRAIREAGQTNNSKGWIWMPATCSSGRAKGSAANDHASPAPGRTKQKHKYASARGARTPNGPNAPTSVPIASKNAATANSGKDVLCSECVLKYCPNVGDAEMRRDVGSRCRSERLAQIGTPAKHGYALAKDVIVGDEIAGDAVNNDLP